MSEQPTQRERPWLWWAAACLVLLVLYVLSSGPVVATAFWLREKTQWDDFYAVGFVYYPLIVFGQDSSLAHYIDWWVKLFGARWPG